MARERNRIKLDDAIRDKATIETIEEILESHPEDITSESLLLALKKKRDKDWCYRVMDMLLDKGADPNVVLNARFTATFVYMLDLPLFMKCVENGLSIDSQDSNGNSLILNILTMITKKEFDGQIIQAEGEDNSEEEEIVRSLLPVAEFLLDEDADLSISNKEGGLPIHWVVTGPYTHRLTPLIMRVIQMSDINAIDNDERTPLMFFATTPEEEFEFNEITPEQIAQILIDAGANPLLRDENGETAADDAEIYGNGELHERLVQFLRQKEQEFREKAQGALVQRTRGRQGINRLPLAIGKRITNFLGGKHRGQKTHKHRLNRKKTHKHRLNRKKTHKRR